MKMLLVFSSCMLVTLRHHVRFHGKPYDFNKLQITWYRRGQCLSPRTAPAMCDCGVITFSGIIAPEGVAFTGGDIGKYRSPGSINGKF